MKNHEKIYVFDFDGTLTYIDTLKLFILIRLLNPIFWHKTIMELFSLLSYRDISKFRFNIQKIIWNKKDQRLFFFKKIFKSIFFSLLIRKDVFNYFKKILDDNQVILITANEVSLVSSFISVFLNEKINNIHLIATNFEIENSKIIKGRLKLIELQKFLRNNNDNLEIISFFDSKSDMHLSKLSSLNVVVGKLNYICIKKTYANVLSFYDFIKLKNNL